MPSLFNTRAKQGFGGDFTRGSRPLRTSLRSWRDAWAGEAASTLHQSSHGFATRVHGFATKTKALAHEIPPATQATLELTGFQMHVRRRPGRWIIGEEGRGRGSSLLNFSPARRGFHCMTIKVNAPGIPQRGGGIWNGCYIITNMLEGSEGFRFDGFGIKKSTDCRFLR